MTQKKLDREAAAAQYAPEATEKDIFGSDQVERVVQKQDDNMQLYDKNQIADLLKYVQEHKEKNGAIDPSKQTERKRTIRVGIYADEEGAEHILVGLTTKTSRDGAVRQTWERGKDEITDQPITWIQPILINLDTGVKTAPEVKYSEFSNILYTVPLEIKGEEKEQVDMTPAPSKGVQVEQVTYGDGHQYSASKSGIYVQLKAWSIHSVYTVVYEDKTYQIDQDVVNYK